MLIGIVGKPNSGKSTFFSAATHVEVKIANYPFTTIEPNKGVGYVRKRCPCSELKNNCNPQDSACINHIRMIPIPLLDVAGIVPDAHEGKGLGLQFLDDMRQADGIIIVVDASGETDLEGNPNPSDPSKEVELIETELREWIKSIIIRNKKDYEHRPVDKLLEVLSALKIDNDAMVKFVDSLGMDKNKIMMDEEIAGKIADVVVSEKPILVFGNKGDRKKVEIKCDRPVIYGSALYELALNKASKAGVVDYVPGAETFEIRNANEEQRKALENIKKFVEANKGTGVISALNSIVFDLLGLITAYPVEDEGKWMDKKENVLPNVKLIRKGRNAHDLAGLIHTDIANGMLYAIDGRSKMKIGKDYIIKDLDVIKIVSASKK
jgi:hypothetical protein